MIFIAFVIKSMVTYWANSFFWFFIGIQAIYTWYGVFRCHFYDFTVYDIPNAHWEMVQLGTHKNHWLIKTEIICLLAVQEVYY